MKKIVFLSALLTTAFLTSGCYYTRLLPPDVDVRVEQNISSRFRGSSATIINGTDEILVGMKGTRTMGAAHPNGGWIVEYPYSGLSYESFSFDFGVRSKEKLGMGTVRRFSISSFSQEEIWFVKKDSEGRLYFTQQ